MKTTSVEVRWTERVSFREFNDSDGPDSLPMRRPCVQRITGLYLATAIRRARRIRRAVLQTRPTGNRPVRIVKITEEDIE